jgi:primase-polymerase (primpol)-like protein
MSIPQNNGHNHRPPRPQALTVQPEHIPVELRVLPQWVNWKYEYRKGKWTKPLYQPNDGYAEDEYAESDNPDTWGTFDAAIAAYLRGSFDGIGFVVTGEDDFAGVDLDHCRDPETDRYWSAHLPLCQATPERPQDWQL